MVGDGLGEKAGLQREQDDREAFPGATNSSIYSLDAQHRTAFCALKHARSSCKTALFMDSELLVDTSSQVSGRRTGPLRKVVAGSRARGVAEVVAWLGRGRGKGR